MHLRLDDSRRLTGPNLFWDYPGAIIDVSISGIDQATVIDIWKTQIRALLDAVGWQQEQITYRKYQGGASLVISAPMDALYAATEVNEAAWHFTLGQLGLETTRDFSATLNTLQHEIQTEANPRLLELMDAAENFGKTFLVDDDHLSIGYGASTQVYPVKELPKADTLQWEAIDSIPLGMITGTNGKSTSVRLASAIISADAKKAGVTTTDYIRVGDTMIDTGDYSGPGGARTLLRNPEVDVALLEVARGGLLRRGLAVTKADAGLITNVAADHLGEYGINTVAELARAKFVIHRALQGKAPLVLNADNAPSVAEAKNLPADQVIYWFAEDESNVLLEESDVCAFMRDNHLIIRCLNQPPNRHSRTVSEHGINFNGNPDVIEHEVIDIREVPITFSGAAKHNVQNAMGASLLCFALGLSLESIKQGLQDFQGDYKDNPGRGNYFEKDGVKIIIDFAHNAHGLTAVTRMMANIEAKRRLVLVCQAGDRSNTDIAAMVQAAMHAKPDVAVVCEIENYLRGRDPGEVPGVITDALLEAGMEANAIIQADSVLSGAQKALDWAEEGDLLLLLALTDRDKVVEMIEARKYFDNII